jgi:hypothetical protein
VWHQIQIQCFQIQILDILILSPLDILIQILLVASGASRSRSRRWACGRKHIPSGIRLLAFHFQILLAFQILQAFQ